MIQYTRMKEIIRYFVSPIKTVSVKPLQAIMDQIILTMALVRQIQQKPGA